MQFASLTHFRFTSFYGRKWHLQLSVFFSFSPVYFLLKQKILTCSGWSIGIGQNGAFGYGSWSSAVRGWHNEVKLFTYGKKYSDNTNPKWSAIGHYTQVSNRVLYRSSGYNFCNTLDPSQRIYKDGSILIKRCYLIQCG